MTQRDALEVVAGCGIGAHCGGSVQSRYLGEIRVGANSQAMVERESIELVVDLREESTACAASGPGLQWTRIPLEDNSDKPQFQLFGEAIHAVESAYRAGSRVAFHCGGGKGRTDTVAAGLLLERGEFHSIEEAEARAKNVPR